MNIAISSWAIFSYRLRYSKHISRRLRLFPAALGFVRSPFHARKCNGPLSKDGRPAKLMRKLGDFRSNEKSCVHSERISISVPWRAMRQTTIILACVKERQNKCEWSQKRKDFFTVFVYKTRMYFCWQCPIIALVSYRTAITRAIFDIVVGFGVDADFELQKVSVSLAYFATYSAERFLSAKCFCPWRGYWPNVFILSFFRRELIRFW